MRGRALRTVLCKREMAWRYAYKLQDNPEPYCKTESIEAMEADGTFDVLPKKKADVKKDELTKLQQNLAGIKEMKRSRRYLYR